MNRVIVSSPRFLATSDILQRLKNKVEVIPFGIDVSHFVPPLVPVQKDKELNLLFVGRLVPYKGLEYLIEALTKAPGKLTIVGRGSAESSVRATIKKCDLEDRVRFTGFLEPDGAALLSAYQSADVIVLPSINRGESFGYALIEGMACETAVICTELGTGTSFVNVHRETGLVIPPRDIQALADAINELDRDRDLLMQFKQAARRRVEEMFDIRTMLEETERLYNQLGIST